VTRITRDEAGFTLVELLLVCVLMVVVLTATLTTLDSFQSNAETNSRQNDAQDETRRATDRLARDLRNLASPTNESPEAIKRGWAQDLIVQSVAEVRPVGSLNLRNTQFVRYCYDSVGQRVMRQRLTWTSGTDPAFPAAEACPGGGWESTQVAAQNVVNGVRPLFTYNSADPVRMTEIHSSLWVDVNPGKRPAESTLSTTVFLRNQNRRPIARFSVARDGTSVVLNGSDSEDPEERALYYFWYDRADPTKVIGQGIVYVHSPTPGKHTYFLTVKDQADLDDTAADQTLCVPGGTVIC
jgi:type II secretory pathway component PulJ